MRDPITERPAHAGLGRIKRYLAQDHARIFDAIGAGVPQDADDVLRRHFAIGE